MVSQRHGHFEKRMYGYSNIYLKKFLVTSTNIQWPWIHYYKLCETIFNHIYSLHADRTYLFMDMPPRMENHEENEGH